MQDQERATRPCPLCKEAVKAEALRCKHCLGVIMPAPTHQGICPYCKESIHVEAIRCQHCQTDLSPVPTADSLGARQGVGARRRYKKGQAESGYVASLQPEQTGPQARVGVCPPYLVDTAPGGGGYGVWVLVDSDDQTCTYQYVGSPSG
jgi:hypothetical protein